MSETVIEIDLTTKIARTPRVQQIEGLFDVAAAERSRQHVIHRLDLPEDWRIGVIVGPSGAGKTQLARKWFGAKLIQGWDWPRGAAVVDAFPKSLGIREITLLLSSVGFGSPPSWVRPFETLSNGEQFRAHLARTLAEAPELAIVDEYSSVVDRNVAQIGSAAVAKTVRRRGGRFVAITCHYDVLDWLEPDWVYQPHLHELRRGRLWRRPRVELTVQRVRAAAWSLFKRHHYLTAELHPSAVCLCAFWRDQPIAFDAWLPFVGRLRGLRRARRIHRTVVLPDFQGIGIGAALNDFGAAIWRGLGQRVFYQTAHPALIVSRRKSAHWIEIRRGFTAAFDGGSLVSHRVRASSRHTVSFEYVGPGRPRAESLKFLGRSESA